MGIMLQFSHYSPVDLAQKRGEPRKNSKKANFGIVGKEIFCRITYPKSPKIPLGENFLYPIYFRTSIVAT